METCRSKGLLFCLLHRVLQLSRRIFQLLSANSDQGARVRYASHGNCGCRILAEGMREDPDTLKIVAWSFSAQARAILGSAGKSQAPFTPASAHTKLQSLAHPAHRFEIFVEYSCSRTCSGRLLSAASVVLHCPGGHAPRTECAPLLEYSNLLPGLISPFSFFVGGNAGIK
jgi:hypothetical protein